MRKVCLVIMFCLVALLFADEKTIFSDNPGSYAIYHDQRFDDDVLLGICYVGNNTIIVRSYETKNKNELMIMMPFKINGDGIEVKWDQISLLTGELNTTNAGNRVIPMVLNWSATWYSSRSKIDEKNTYNITTDDDYFYQSWIPVFQIELIGKKNDFSLIAAGKLKNKNDPKFFKLNNIPQPIDSEVFSLNADEKKNAIIDGLQVPLDNNWNSSDNRAYKIAKKSSQDAIFMIETFDYSKAGFKSIKQVAKAMIISQQEMMILAEGTQFIDINGNYTIIIRMYDPKQKKVTIQHTRFFDRDNGVVSMASLACYETLYKNNKTYFDSILY